MEQWKPFRLQPSQLKSEMAARGRSMSGWDAGSNLSYESLPSDIVEVTTMTASRLHSILLPAPLTIGCARQKLAQANKNAERMGTSPRRVTGLAPPRAPDAASCAFLGTKIQTIESERDQLKA